MKPYALSPNIHGNRYALIGVVLALLLAGCVQSTPTATSASPETRRTPKPTFTPLPTSTPVPPTATPSATRTFQPSPLPTDTATMTPSPTATATSLPPTTTPAPTNTVKPTDPPPPDAVGAAKPLAAQIVSRARLTPLVLANYFVWYDSDTWDDCNISDGDRPQQAYSSDDGNAVERHVHLALDAGIDGFTQQWAAPRERTDRNFRTLLDRSRGTSFRSTVIFLRHIWPDGATQAKVVEAVRYLHDQYGGHPNFLKVGDKPVIIFTDIYRVTPDASDKSALQFWTEIRGRVDPGNKMIWIAEGLDASYLQVFDGLYVYKITHADYPDDYVKASRWAADVRKWEAITGATKIWMATISPGWDDRRSTCKTDIRVASKPHKRERGDGAFYRATYEAALASSPDWLWINSFNEWVEGTYIESSVKYGDRAMQLTSEFARQFKGQ